MCVKLPPRDWNLGPCPHTPIIPLLYFQNYLKRKLINIFKKSHWGTFLVALLRITLFKKTDKFI